jgi:predicted membrane channel-forming protein YqfA (hemolysin III family)
MGFLNRLLLHQCQGYREDIAASKIHGIKIFVFKRFTILIFSNILENFEKIDLKYHSLAHVMDHSAINLI